MAAYIIAEVEVTDPAVFEQRYRPLVAPTLAKYGGRFLVRGGPAEALEGAAAKRIVMLEFDNAAAARRWYESPEYREAMKIRWASATARLLLVEGVTQ